eukprot:CAMPEP_0202092712 /NCGR_PEP_ID=MMETSP0964-20121228/48176_1 /ASSEMBLY_ACC=CAM_ASM_000500 /TAXON_ID=4773 /ORGANISM="Schizochytrium aggregatum, Strain ATCC28209" /LENGTH=370 /DNA_ID=CAMNT_0048660955 /DNA_START=46 /DNA_END=1159 /DNA_ORIENTATION=+
MAGHAARQALLRFGAGAALFGVGGAVATAIGPRAQCDEIRADKPEFWTSRWAKMAKSNITPGFHSSEVHPRLKEFSSRLVGDLPAGGRRILVPLCGKTLDLLYLSKIGETSGVECAQEAIDGFGADNSLTPNLGSKTTKDTRLFDFGAPGPDANSSEVHPRLKEFSARLVGDLPAGGRRILVPLCGQSLDLIFLSRFAETSGVECAQEAIDGFGADNSLTPNLGSKTTKDTRLFDFGAPGPDASPIKIGKFNFFELPKAWDGKDAKFTMAWDRAAFVAIHPESRDKYAKALADQMAPGGKVLMCTMSYDTSKMDGPPFSLSPEQVADHCGQYFSMEKLDSRDIIEFTPEFREAGLTEVFEDTLLLTRLPQ